MKRQKREAPPSNPSRWSSATDNRPECQLRRIGAAAAVMQTVYQSVMVRRDVPHPQSWALGGECKYETTDARGGNQLSLKGGWLLLHRWGEEVSQMEENILPH